MKEPTIEELIALRKELVEQASNDNLKKIRAIDAQLKRKTK